MENELRGNVSPDSLVHCIGVMREEGPINTIGALSHGGDGGAQ